MQTRTLSTALASSLALLFGGCGLIVDAISDASATDFEAEVFPAETIGDEYLAPLTFSIAVDQANPTYGLSDGIDTTGWGAVIAAHNAFPDDGIFEFGGTGSFELTGSAPVRFTVDVSSRDEHGLVVSTEEGVGLVGDPVDVAACEFVLEPGIDGQAEFDAAMNLCLTEWVAANGIPVALDLDITTGFASRQTGSEYRLAYDDTSFRAHHNTEASFFVRNLDVDGDVVRNRDIIDFGELSIASWARWNKIARTDEGPDCTDDPNPLRVFGWGSVRDTTSAAATPRNTAGIVLSRMTEATEHRFDITVRDDGSLESLQSDYDLLAFAPLMPEWIEETLDIAVDVLAASDAEDGSTASVPLPVVGGYIVTGHCPRRGEIHFDLQGVAQFGGASE